MIEKNAIKKGPPKRDPACYQVLQNIVIPKGTMLRAAGEGKFSAPVGLYAELVIRLAPGEAVESDKFKRVISV